MTIYDLRPKQPVEFEYRMLIPHPHSYDEGIAVMQWTGNVVGGKYEMEWLDENREPTVTPLYLFPDEFISITAL